MKKFEMTWVCVCLCKYIPNHYSISAKNKMKNKKSHLKKLQKALTYTFTTHGKNERSIAFVLTVGENGGKHMLFVCYYLLIVEKSSRTQDGN